MTRRPALLVLTLALTPSLLHAADWPRFRGPNGAGVADGPLPSLDPKAALWRVPVPGKGAGSPIVVGGKVFLQTASADGSKRTLLCLNAADGSTVWATDAAGSQTAMHKKNTLASSTPASDGTLVYCVWWTGADLTLHAYDMAGVQKWVVPLGAYKSEHGAGHSPAVFGDKVYVNFDQDQQAKVMAFHKASGEKAWAADRAAHRASYTTPFVLERPGQPAELIVASTTGVDAYDPDTGKVRWHYTMAWADPKKKLRMIAAPVFSGGLLVFTMGEGGSGRYGVALKPGTSGELPASAKAWDKKKQVPYVPSMIARGDLLFWVHDDGRAVCAEAKTGNVLWEESIFGAGVTASPVLVGDSLVAISEKGQVAVLKALKEFEIPKKTELGEPVLATPAVADGRVFVRGASELVCFGKK